MLLEDEANLSKEIFNDIKVEYNRVKDIYNLDEWMTNLYANIYVGLDMTHDTFINPTYDDGELRSFRTIYLFDIVKDLASARVRLEMENDDDDE